MNSKTPYYAVIFTNQQTNDNQNDGYFHQRETFIALYLHCYLQDNLTIIIKRNLQANMTLSIKINQVFYLAHPFHHSCVYYSTVPVEFSTT